MTYTPTPVEEAVSAGARGASFHQLDGGPWTGEVWDHDETCFEVQQRANDWMLTTSDGTVHKAKTLAAVVKRVVLA